MSVLQRVAHAFFGKYALYRIYKYESASQDNGVRDERCRRLAPDGRELVAVEDDALRQLATYAGEEAFGFGLWEQGVLAAVCWFWTGERYRQRNFWPLREREAKLVVIVTREKFRGRGLAPVLIRNAARQMQAMGVQRLFASVWHSNHASSAAFQKAGWEDIAFVAEVHPCVTTKPIRLVWRRGKMP